MSNPIRFIISVLLLCFQLVAVCQNDTLQHNPKQSYNPFLCGYISRNTLVLGFNMQQKGDIKGSNQNQRYVEIGLHKTHYTFGRHGTSSYTYGFSTLIGTDKDKIVGFRAGLWTTYLFSVGLNMTYFTNFKQGNLKITPQLGVGMGGFRAVAGYNIPTFFNKDFAGLRYSAGQISISYLLPIKTIKDDRVRCNY